MTLVSIIIPFYNRAEFLPRVLSSVAALKFRPLQLILVNNGSTDNSLQIVENFQRKNEQADFQIQLLTEPVAGAAKARNAGLREAKGKYVYFFDSDDEMSDGFLEEAVTLAEANQLDVVAARTAMVQADGRLILRDYGYSLDVADQILTGKLSTQSLFFQKTFLLQLGGWNPRLFYWDDWELGIRVLLAHPRIQWLKSRIYHRIYVHPASITGTSFHDSFDKICVAFHEVEHDLSFVHEAATHSAQLALCFRKSILAGLLWREKHDKIATACLQSSRSKASGFFCRALISFLFLYTRWGGRGAWRLAVKICRLCNN